MKKTGLNVNILQQKSSKLLNEMEVLEKEFQFFL